MARCTKAFLKLNRTVLSYSLSYFLSILWSYRNFTAIHIEEDSASEDDRVRTVFHAPMSSPSNQHIRKLSSDISSEISIEPIISEVERI